MGLEAATYISSLDQNNPLQTDLKREGDNHLRLIKRVLQETFPGASRPFTFPTAALKTANFGITAAQANTLFYVSTAGGVQVNASLPALAAADAGWSCQFVKTNTGLFPLYIFPAGGTVQSGEIAGLPYARRAIPGHATTAMWTGGGWFLTRVPSVPVGSCLEFHGASLPVGYEWPNSQNLNTTLYPEYAAVVPGGGTLDRNERIAAMVDKLGVSRLATHINGDVFGWAAGTETHTLSLAEMASHLHNVATFNTVDGPGAHSHYLSSFDTSATINPGENSIAMLGVLGGDVNYRLTSGPSAPTQGRSSTEGAHNHNIPTHDTDARGGGLAHINLQPTIMTNFILVVE